VILNDTLVSGGFGRSIRTPRGSKITVIDVDDRQKCSSRGRPMLKVLEDTIGVHDYTVPACDASRYEVDFGISRHRNCLENMHAALEGYGAGTPEVPDPFNLFQNSPATAGPRTGIVDVPAGTIASPSSRSWTSLLRCLPALRTSFRATALLLATGDDPSPHIRGP